MLHVGDAAAAHPHGRRRRRPYAVRLPHHLQQRVPQSVRLHCHLIVPPGGAEDVEDEALVGGDVDVGDLQSQVGDGVHDLDEAPGPALAQHLQEELVGLHLPHLHLRLHVIPLLLLLLLRRRTGPLGPGERVLVARGRRLVVLQPHQARRRRVVQEDVGGAGAVRRVLQLVLQRLHLVLQAHDVVDGVPEDRRAVHLGDVRDERPELVEPLVELLPPLPLRLEVLALLPLPAALAAATPLRVAVAVVLWVPLHVADLGPRVRIARLLLLLQLHRLQLAPSRSSILPPGDVVHPTTTGARRLLHRLERVRRDAAGGVEQAERRRHRIAVHPTRRVRGAAVPRESRRPRAPLTAARHPALRHHQLRHLLLLRHARISPRRARRGRRRRAPAAASSGRRWTRAPAPCHWSNLFGALARGCSARSAGWTPLPRRASLQTRSRAGLMEAGRPALEAVPRTDCCSRTQPSPRTSDQETASSRRSSPRRRRRQEASTRPPRWPARARPRPHLHQQPRTGGGGGLPLPWRRRRSPHPRTGGLCPLPPAHRTRSNKQQQP
uniref:Uncharacterized protein n=1 Tax=Zea mays TaxID=4577 RepID=C0P3Z1_MAIZE|nr:unknown [Zea mays]